MQPFRDVYQLLDHARDRPGMYGIGAKSFRQLQAFLAGLSWGDVDPGTPSLWDFHWWVTVRKDVVGTSMPWHWLEKTVSDEEAYQIWFELLDEYRTNHEVELSRLPGDLVHHLPTYTYENGVQQPYRHPIATAIVLGRYEPSNVYFATEVFPDRTEKLRVGFQPTLDQTLLEVKHWWSIEPAAWKLT